MYSALAGACTYSIGERDGESKREQKQRGGKRMKLNGIKVSEGVKIKTVGLDDAERKMLSDAIRTTLRRIQYKRKKENRRSLLYWMSLK